MSEQQNYDDSLAEINGVATPTIKWSSVPYGIFILEAKKTCKIATDNFVDLAKLGYKQSSLDKLQVLCGALAIAEINWETQSTKQKDAQNRWKKDVPAMNELTSELYDNMRFAYRMDDRLLSILDEIKKGESNADAVMDLGRLGTLGRDNPEPLVAIGFDITQCDTALSESERMANLLAEVNGNMYVDDDNKVIRDKAFTLVKVLVDEVRDYGKFAFRKDPDKAKLFASKYQRDQKAEYRRNKKMEESELAQAQD